MRLSIIICVYNTDREHLSECLDSITDSTLFKIRDEYEICIVDDGSTADYSDLAKKHGARLKKTKNQGIYAARATGLSMARGKFTCFCDSDDTVSHDYYLPMLETAESNGADIIINGWANRTPRAAYYPSGDETITEDFILSGKEKLLKFFEHEGRYHSFYVLWNKLYRTELLKKCFENLCASGYKGFSYAEDTAINFFAFRDANIIENIHTGFYFYRIHPAQSVNTTNVRKLLLQIEGMCEAFRIMKTNLPKDSDEKTLRLRIAKWEHLMAKTHLAVATSLGYDAMFSVIEEKYGISIEKLKLLKVVKSHRGNRLLPSNFKDIDYALLSLHKSDTPLAVKYNKKDAYVSSCMRRIIASGKVTHEKRSPDVTVQRAKIPAKLRIIHSPVIYKIGTRLFKKGSKVREFLKRFI